MKGSVLRPSIVVFVIHSRFDKIAKRLGVEADDSQTNVLSTPDTSQSSDRQLLTCLQEMATWLQANCLCLKSSKSSQVYVLQCLQLLDDSLITLCGVQITPVASVRNQGVIMDSSSSFISHVNHVSAAASIS